MGNLKVDSQSKSIHKSVNIASPESHSFGKQSRFSMSKGHKVTSNLNLDELQSSRHKIHENSDSKKVPYLHTCRNSMVTLSKYSKNFYKLKNPLPPYKVELLSLPSLQDEIHKDLPSFSTLDLGYPMSTKNEFPNITSMTKREKQVYDKYVNTHESNLDRHIWTHKHMRSQSQPDKDNEFTCTMVSPVMKRFYNFKSLISQTESKVLKFKKTKF